MPPGATNLGDNRFALLSSSSRPKRKKAESTKLEIYPELPTVKKDDPKYITINSLDDNKPLSSLSCFAVHKGILAISKEINNITELRDGSLLLLVKNIKIAEKFLAAKSLPGVCEIKAKLHDKLNCVKGTIFAPFLSNVTDDDIIEGLKPHGVTSIYKFVKTTNGVSNPTGCILLSFDKYKLPEKIEVAWRILSVRPYIPNPMRCKSCQKLGHTKKFCKGLPVCAICSFPPHDQSECIRILCANCAGDHPSHSNICPKFQQSKEILKIKTLEKCTMREAVKKYKDQISIPHNPSSFANVIKSTAPISKNLSPTENNSNNTISNLAPTKNNTNNTIPTNNNFTIQTATNSDFANVINTNIDLASTSTNNNPISTINFTKQYSNTEFANVINTNIDLTSNSTNNNTTLPISQNFNFHPSSLFSSYNHTTTNETNTENLTNTNYDIPQDSDNSTANILSRFTNTISSHRSIINSSNSTADSSDHILPPNTPHTDNTSMDISNS